MAGVDRPGLVAAFLVGLVLATAAPTDARACSPRPLYAELLSPDGSEAIPTTAVFWLSVGGYDFNQRVLDPRVELLAPDGTPVALTFSAVRTGNPTGSLPGASRTLRAQVELEPGARYTLSYTTALAATGTVAGERRSLSLLTRSTGALDPPPAPTVEMGYWRARDGAPLPLPCSDAEFDEFTKLFVTAEHAAALHLRTRYADESSFSEPTARALRSGAGGDVIVVHSSGRGIPCVELIAEGPDGARSSPTMICEPVGCGEGPGWLAGLDRDIEWWRSRLGPGTCAGLGPVGDAGAGCRCVASDAASPWSLLAVLMLVFWRSGGLRPRRRAGPVERSSGEQGDTCRRQASRSIAPSRPWSP